jgi:hypothetical protein
MLDKSSFSQAIDQVLQDEGRVTVALVPGVFQLGGGDQPLEPRYRTRALIESVRCAWASTEINALALVAMAREDYDAARLWAEYVAFEASADKLILAEGAQYGVDEARVRSTPPLPSLVVAGKMMVQNILTLGSLPAVAHAVAVEWSSVRASVVPAEQRSKEAIGLEFIKAIAAHPDSPQGKEHASRVLEVAHRLITRRPDGIPLFFGSLRQSSALMRAFFGELYMFGGMEVYPRQGEQPQQQPRGRAT